MTLLLEITPQATKQLASAVAIILDTFIKLLYLPL